MYTPWSSWFYTFDLHSSSSLRVNIPRTMNEGATHFIIWAQAQPGNRPRWQWENYHPSSLRAQKELLFLAALLSLYNFYNLHQGCFTVSLLATQKSICMKGLKPCSGENPFFDHIHLLKWHFWNTYSERNVSQCHGSRFLLCCHHPCTTVSDRLVKAVRKVGVHL